jgi:hypothetical protein
MRGDERRRLRYATVPFSHLLLFCALTACAPATDQGTISVTSSPTPDPAIARDAEVSAIYALVKKRDMNGVLALAYPPAPVPSTSPVPSASMTAASAAPTAPAKPVTDPAIALSLFMLDRDRYRDVFVAAYPHSLDGVNGDYGYRLDRAGLDPRGSQYPILAISGLATGGSDDARKALLGALPYAEGDLARVYDTQAARVLGTAPVRDALTDLATLPSQIRIAAVSEIDWCGRRPDALLAAAPESVPSEPRPPATAAQPSPGGTASTPAPLVESLVQQQIRQSLAMCDYVAARTHDEQRAQRRALAQKHKHRKPKHPRNDKKT